MRESKICSKCKVEKEISKFSPTKRNSDGSVKYRSSWCSDCKKKNYRETSKVPQKRTSEVNLEEGTKLCIECSSWKSLDEFYKNNRGLGGVASYCKECSSYLSANKYYDKEYSREQSKRYREENREVWRAKHRIHQFNRRSLIKASEDGTVDEEFVKTIYSMEVCYWCNEFVDENERTLEHIIELCEGGKHSADNITMACRSCNSARYNKGVKESEH